MKGKKKKKKKKKKKTLNFDSTNSEKKKKSAEKRRFHTPDACMVDVPVGQRKYCNFFHISVTIANWATIFKIHTPLWKILESVLQKGCEFSC